MTIEKICVIGLGYIGLPTASVFALAGKSVIGVDCNAEIVAGVNQGRSHFAEPELAEILKQVVRQKRLSARTAPEPADVFIIAVPTPLAGRRPDLSAVFDALQSLIPVLTNGNLIVLESTSPVGTTEQLARYVCQARPELTELHFAYCPERVLPGNIMHEIYHNDRIVGGLTPSATEQALALYRIFTQGECIPTTARTAELCKLAENSFRDVNIAFANELSMLCDTLEVDVWELIHLANRHPRVNILQAGAGVGGHCIAVDPWFIIHQLPEQAKLIRCAREVNDAKPQWVLEKIKTLLAECTTASERKPSEINIACLGLAFKANVGDLRESPALAITQQLAEWHRGQVWVVEPHISALPEILQKTARLVPLDHALKQADIVVLLVDHIVFKQCDPAQINTPWRLDTRGIWQ